MATCYRHPSRETGVSCSSCGRPICPDCMTPTSVGMRCPECSRQRTKVKTIASVGRGDPIATYVLIAINVLVYLGTSSLHGDVRAGCGIASTRGPLCGPDIAYGHEYWRLVTSGFLHAGLTHLLFNMLFLYFLGTLLEPAIGRANFVALYFVSLLTGSFGALLLQPEVNTVGASGACFGLLGGAIVIARARGISIWNSGLGGTLAINIVFSLTFRGISIGGHLGGLLGGILVGLCIVELGERRSRRWLVALGSSAVGVASVAGAIAVAGGTGLAPNGVGFG
jgi:membrane associated rhomboid family serine protease